MTESHSNNEIPVPILRGVLDGVYALAESLYLMSGGEIPDGCKFARSINELSEHCYKYAAITYYNELNRCDSTA